MKRMMIAIAAAALCLVAAFNSLAAPAKASKQQIAHGEYLVKSVAGCADCHTPMNERGEPIQAKWLQGLS